MKIARRLQHTLPNRKNKLTRNVTFRNSYKLHLISHGERKTKSNVLPSGKTNYKSQGWLEKSLSSRLIENGVCFDPASPHARVTLRQLYTK